MDTNIRTAIARLHCPRCGRAKNACCGLAMHDEITRLRTALLPFATIDLTQTQPPVDFAFLVLKARDALREGGE